MKTSKLGGRCALAALILQSTALLGQPVVSAYAATQSQIAFDIPRGPLSSIITAIAAAAHEQIAFSSDLVAPFQAGPIRGRKSVREALSEALHGTGLSVTLGPAGALAIRRSDNKATASNAALDIADIDVNGKSSQLHDDGFQAGDAGSSTRLADTPAKDIPLAVSSVTSGVLESESITNVQDALQNVAGVSVLPSTVGSPTFTIRGFQNDSGYTTDGAGSNFYSSGVPIDDVERIDVLKGPTSILTGVTADGGVVNIETKKPTDKTIKDVTLRYGSFGYKTLAFDLGGLVPQTEGLTYRFVISGNNADQSYGGYKTPTNTSSLLRSNGKATI